MPAQLTYGTAGATGGGFSAFKGLQTLFAEERLDVRPDWSWQRRSAKTWKDRNAWFSCWSYGCRVGGGSPIGSDGVGWYDLSMKDLFEPYSCDGEGTSISRFIRGTTKDASGVAVADATVQVFRTSDDLYVGQDVSRSDGTYIAPCDLVAGTACYLVAYKSGSPATAGTTVNTLTSTLVDGT